MLRRALVLLSLSSLCAACETDDPCILRQAACLDVKLTGNPAPDMDHPLTYRNLAVRVMDSGGKDLVPPVQLAELRATAPATTEAIVSFRLLDSFNDLPDDMNPKQVLRDLPPDQDPVAKLKMLRAGDPRAVHILVTGNDAGGAAVRWDSQEEEQARIDAAEKDGNPDPWLQLMYFRVGHNEYQAAYAYLLRVMMM